jgi:hypothetical protein
MSRENVEVVRRPLSLRASPRRAPLERLAVRVPSLFAVVRRWAARLAPQSRIRQAMLCRMAEQQFAATNRGDFALVLQGYHPAVEIVTLPELITLGLADSYRGHRGFLQLWSDWDSAWAGHAQWEPRELIDLGDRLVAIARMRGVGEASGAGVDLDMALLLTLKNGLIIREQHLPPAEALEAVGLRE